MTDEIPASDTAAVITAEPAVRRVSRKKPEPEKEPAGEMHATPVSAPEPIPEPLKPDVMEGLRAILDQPKGKSAIPSLVSFEPNNTPYSRYCIVDIPDSILSNGWRYWKEYAEDKTPEAYLSAVYRLTSTDIPRLYRNVAPIHLV